MHLAYKHTKHIWNVAKKKTKEGILKIHLLAIAAQTNPLYGLSIGQLNKCTALLYSLHQWFKVLASLFEITWSLQIHNIQRHPPNLQKQLKSLYSLLLVSFIRLPLLLWKPLPIIELAQSLKLPPWCFWLLLKMEIFNATTHHLLIFSFHVSDSRIVWEKEEIPWHSYTMWHQNVNRTIIFWT